MKAQDIFNRGKTYWSIELNIEDGEFIDEIEGFRSKNLTNAWEIAEKKAHGNDWDELAVWIIYGLLHIKSKNAFRKNIYKISLNQVTIEDFKKELLQQLQYEGYEEMLSVFKQEDK